MLRAGAAALCIVVPLASYYALAAPPANTRIGNQASASYLDPSGQMQIATSNLVETLVQQVGAFTLESDNGKSAATGNTVYMPHILTNTGNGTDSFDIKVSEGAGTPDFSRIEVFLDANGDGLPDSTTPLCSSAGAPLCTTGFTQSVAGNGGEYKFVVAYSVPATATTAGWPSNTGTVTAEVNAASPVFSTYAASSDTDTDTITLTDQAAFSVTKAIQAPAVVAVGGGAWPAALTSGQASPVTGCTTIWPAGGAASLTAGCIYTVYTLRYTNTGGAAGALSIRDALPAGFTYIDGSAVWSSAPGTALNDATGAVGDPAGITYESVSGTIRATVASVPANVTGTISFVVLVDSDAAVDDSNTGNAARYSTNTCADPDGACTDGTTNKSSFDVLPTYGVVAGNASGLTTPDDVEDSPSQSGINLVTRTSAVAGGAASFSTYVTNRGNTDDSFNLTMGSSDFPAGTTFSYFRADGVSPLLDTTGDGIADTGPVAAGLSFNVVVRANVPSSASVGAGPYNALMIAKSVGDTSSSSTNDDTVWIRVNTIIGSLVDLTNSALGTGSGTVAGGDLGPGPGPQATTTKSTPAGTGVTFALFVKNNDTTDNSYTLAASQSPAFPGSLPSGWTVTFHAAGGACGSPTIAATATVIAGTQAEVSACATPPANATIGTQSIYFQAKSVGNSSSGGLVADTKLDAVTVTVPDLWAWTLAPSNTGQAAPGGSVVYSHTISNLGNKSCGKIGVTATLSAADMSIGWTSVLYVDVNGDGQIDPGDTLVTEPLSALSVGAETRLLVKVLAPGGVTTGTVSAVTVSISDADTDGDGNSCAVASAIDTTTVVTGQLRLIKAQAHDANCDGAEEPSNSAQIVARPGECMVYKVMATNQGAAPIGNVSMNDAVPAYTRYTGATQPALSCASTGLTGTAVGFSATGAPVVAVSCGSASNSLAPGGTVTLRYAVRVDPL